MKFRLLIAMSVVLMSSVATFAEEDTIATVDPTKTIVHMMSLHYTPLGIARSYSSFGVPERDYFFGGMGVSVFAFRMDRVLLLGNTFSYASRIPQDDSTIYVALVPAAFRVYKTLYFAVTLGTVEITDVEITDYNYFRLNGHRAVGAQFSLCVAGC